jgi:hypothetical protein
MKSITVHAIAFKLLLWMVSVVYTAGLNMSFVRLTLAHNKSAFIFPLQFVSREQYWL